MRLAAGLLALTLIVGCGSDGPTAVAGVEGTWNLLSVNTSPLPFTLGTLPDGAKLEVVSQSVTMSGGKYTSATVFRSTPPAGSAFTTNDGDAGSYVQAGSTLTFQSSTDNSTLTAEVCGNRFTTTGGGVTLIFGKS
jgi:hypothetical protein